MSDNPNDKYDVVLDHEYDGIQELNNPLPMWWLWTFFGTIIFAFIYWIHYSVGGGMSLDGHLQAQLQQIEEQKQLEAKNQPQKNEADLETLPKNAAVVAQGNKVFQMNCANCHGDKGQGGIGPNLTDNYWIHGDGKMTSVMATIKDGVLEKGMPSWGPIFKPEEIEALAAFVVNLRGSNPANAKAPQGEDKGS
ncbi:MAG: c-type cytochrome [Bdellovibrionaceae bacterium]|nr:c-type cytochrome [Pseudobdellovibrionaceae bacterium]